MRCPISGNDRIIVLRTARDRALSNLKNPKMVWHCCLCETESGTIDNISFHSIPKNEKLRASWLAVIGKTVAKSSSVCSTHFSERDFKYKLVGGTIRRFPLPGAIPSRLPNPHIDGQAEVIKINPSTTTHSSLREQNCSKGSETPEGASNSNVPPVATECNRDENAEMKKLKRKSAKPLTGPKRFCNARVVGDLRREDFTSDTSWNIVQSLVERSKKKCKILNQKVTRLSRKVQTLEELLSHVKDKGLLSNENNKSYLGQGSGSVVYNLD